MANTYIIEDMDEDLYFSSIDDSANASFDANTFYANTTIVSDYDEDATDETAVANTSGSLGDVYDAGDTYLGTDQTGITNDESAGVDAIPGAETVNDFINGNNHAPQLIPDRRFFPQPVEAAAGSLYKGQKAPIKLNSGGVPLLGMLFNKTPQNVAAANQSPVALPASKSHNSTAGRGATTRQHTKKVGRNTKGAGKNTSGNKMTCGTPKLLSLNNNKNVTRVYCGTRGLHVDIPLYGAGDATEITGPNVVKSGNWTYTFGCCKRKDDTGKDHYGVGFEQKDSNGKTLRGFVELKIGKGQKSTPNQRQDKPVTQPPPLLNPNLVA